MPERLEMVIKKLGLACKILIYLTYYLHLKILVAIQVCLSLNFHFVFC